MWATVPPRSSRPMWSKKASRSSRSGESMHRPNEYPTEYHAPYLQETAMTEFAPLTEREVVPSADAIDLKIEAVVLPVADVGRSKRFYGGLGWRLDADFVVGDGRLIQFTPPGSACS